MRRYKRKTERGKVPLATMQQAADQVMRDNRKVRTVAKEYNICHVTLYRFVKKVKNKQPAVCGYIPNRQIFTADQERMIADYTINASAIYFGLSPQEVRKLAYECAQKFDIEVPESWKLNGKAGADWLSGFMKRNPNLSIRTPEATSLARATSFNQQNVSTFFDKLAEVMDRRHFEACDVWNFDETGVTTVQKPKKIVTAKGVKQVGAITSAERGELVTVALSVSADGKMIPPMFIFPRKVYKNHFINGAPVGSIGVANSSGWMTEGDFKTYVQHFVKHTRASVDRPVLLLLDNHCSHLSVDALNLAKESGVVMLSFPPHCSHRLQPLDRTVYGAFKKYVSAAQDGWMRSNPGKTMSIYDLPQIVATALPPAANAANICSGFKVAGIVPFNRHIFQDADFLPSSVTDRPDPQESQTMSVASETPSVVASETPATPGAVRSSSQPVPFSPEIVRPYPKAGPRKSKRNNKRKRCTAILTDTPVKNALEEEKRCKAKKVRSEAESSEQRKSKNKHVTSSEMRTKVDKKMCKKKEVTMTVKNGRHGKNGHPKATCRETTCKRPSSLPLRRGSSIRSLPSSSQSSCRPRRPVWLDKYNVGKSTFSKL